MNWLNDMLQSDPDPQETREWIDSMQAVIEKNGALRAHKLLEGMVEVTRRAGAYLPFSPTTEYVNTIAPPKEAKSPGEAALEWRMMAGVYAPELSVHASEGALGSQFAFTGSGFPAHKPATVFVNGRYLGRVMTDGQGMAQFIVQSPTAPVALGHYDITLEVDMNASATQGFTLREDAPLVWAPDGFMGRLFVFGERLPQ